MASVDYKARRDLHKQRETAKIYDFLQSTYDVWLKYTEPKRATWRVCSAFKNGLQWGVFDRFRQRLVFPDPPIGRVQMTDNMIRSWAMDMEAKMCRPLPRPEATPVRNTTEAKEAADAAERLGQHYWWAQNWDINWPLVNRVVLEFGDAFTFKWWDPQRGPTIATVRYNRDGNPLTGEISFEGDIINEVLSPFSVVTDLTPTTVDEKYHFMIATWETCEEIYNRYGKEIEPVKASQYKDDHYDGIARMVTGGGGRFEKPQLPGADGAILFRWFQRQQKGIEKGFELHMANGVQLKRGDWPVEYAQMQGNPVVQYSWYPDTIHFYSQSPIEDQIPIQRQINKTESQVIESKDAMANIKWFVPNGSGITQITDLNGEMVKFNWPYKPEQGQLAPLPVYVFRHADEMRASMEDKQLLHKASRGINPAGVRSAVALLRLQEQDDRPLYVPTTLMQGALTLDFTKIIQIARQMITNERTIRYVGEGNIKSVMTFKAADLHDHTTITMRIQSGLSKSQAAVDELALQTFQIGGMKRPDGTPDTARLMDILQYSLPDSVFDEDNRHRAIAREENALLWAVLEGSSWVPPAAEWERHDIHLDEHEREMNSMKWKKLAAQNEQFFQAWQQHRLQHIQLMAVAAGIVRPEMGSEPTQEAQNGPAKVGQPAS